MTTLSINLTDEQVWALVAQLPPERKRELFTRLAQNEWPEWTRLVSEAEPLARRLAAERGLDLDALSDEERLNLIDDLLHDKRA